jgi:dehydrogenase/reductase SDR family protein 1
VPYRRTTPVTPRIVYAGLWLPGASRGIGKGIATVLGEQGATVCVTGRTTAVAPNATFGTINEVAEGITAAGGVGIAVRCDIRA